MWPTLTGLSQAALLIGHCCTAAVEFRQSLLTSGGLRRLVCVLRQSVDIGAVSNLTWALVQYLADIQCPIGECLLKDIQEQMPRLFSFRDIRIIKHAVIVAKLVEALLARPLLSRPKQVPSLAIRRDKSLQAVAALTELASMRQIPPDDEALNPHSKEGLRVDNLRHCKGIDEVMVQRPTTASKRKYDNIIEYHSENKLDESMAFTQVYKSQKVLPVGVPEDAAHYYSVLTLP